MVGGAQGYYHIKPDLTCLGKVIGAGLPMGVVGGRKEILMKAAPLTGSDVFDVSNSHRSSAADVLFHSGTYNGHPLILKAGLSVGISVDPPAPSLSQKVRQDIEARLPDWYGSLGQRLAACRKRLKELEPDARVRSRIMGRLTEYGLAHEGRISDSVFDKIIDEEKNL